MYRKLQLTLWVAGFIVLSLVLAACGAAAPAGGEAAPATPSGGEGQAATAGEPIKVGAIFDLTGATSDVSTPYSQGVEGFVEWINAKGGIEGRPIALTSQDYAYKVDQAEQLYSQFVGDGAVVFMGWGTGDTEALRSRVAADEVPFMSGSYSAALDDQEQAPYNFLVGTTYSDQMVIALRWLLEDWQAKGAAGAPKVAVLHNDSPFGQSPLADGEAFAKANGMEFTGIPMARGSTDLTPELTQAQSFGANYIIIQNVSSPAALLLKNKAALGMDDVQVICLNWCADEILVNLAEGAAEGVVGTIPFTPPGEKPAGLEDARAFLTSKGENLDEIGLHYGQGWVTMAVMAEGIRRTLADGKEVTGPNVKAALETLAGYDTGGVTSPITFTGDDHAGSNALRIYQVKDGTWTAISDFISAE